MTKKREYNIKTLYTRINGAYYESARGELLCDAVLNMQITEEERVRVTEFRETLKQISTECKQLSKKVAEYYATIGKEGA